MPALLLRLEGAALFVVAIALYLDGEWSVLALLVLFLAPDLAALAYLAGRGPGAIAYDVAHFEALPLLLGATGIVAGWELGAQLALIWLAHIGVDRALGYGLKYPGMDPKRTHLQRL